LIFLKQVGARKSTYDHPPLIAKLIINKQLADLVSVEKLEKVLRDVDNLAMKR